MRWPRVRIGVLSYRGQAGGVDAPDFDRSNSPGMPGSEYWRARKAGTDGACNRAVL